ncbi:helix-hairpin-helix domain-containing protein [Cupriavidus sp. D384]|uniref:ComEA family DNA-binding protein n=1 Tax=Cupriavidus sp. D384 TaxID=1538095 RepID=UPI000AE7D80B|nr:helix-hairpin-helix domain-containing protein [Cupriavidus sp. D384]
MHKMYNAGPASAPAPLFPGFLSSMSRGALRACRRSSLALAFMLALAGAGPAHAAVDVNSADEAALGTIKGIGPATAKRILTERDKNGAFKDAVDLADRVPGVGPKSAANLQEAGLTFGKASATAPAARKDGKPTPKPAPKAAAAR